VIYKRGGVYHYQFSIGGKRYRGTTKTTNKAAALRVEAEKRITCCQRVNKATERSEDLDFPDAMIRFLTWAKLQVKPRTHQRYGVSSRRLSAHFGEIPIRDLDTNGVERFKAIRVTECSPAGTNRDLACLRTFRNWCVRMELPIGRFHVQFLPEQSGNLRIVSHAEKKTYLGSADSFLRDVATIIVETGMRPAELFALCGDNISLNERYVVIPTGKTRFARRTIPLTTRAFEVLNRLWKPGALFPGAAAHQVAMRRHTAVCKRLGACFRLYDFRHTYGSRMAMAGVDLMTLRELMGHSSITIMQRYCHPTPEHKRTAMARLESYNAEKATKKPQSEWELIPGRLQVVDGGAGWIRTLGTVLGP
jgi:integrase